MTERLYRLADSTAAEPLINRWYATAFRISPVTASLMLPSQLEVLRAYLAGPQASFDAAHNPAFAGAAFVDVPPQHAGQVRELLERSERELADQILLGRTILEYSKALVDQAKGQSLEPFYSLLPAALRGRVELVYDYQGRPSVRLLEGMFYRSGYAKRALQSFCLSRIERDGARPFVISTPRVRLPDRFEWDVPFDDPRVNALFQLDVKPAPLERVRELLGGKEDAQLLPLLSAGPVEPRPRWNEPRVRVRYFGHACVLFEWNGISILTDPNIATRPTSGGVDRLSYGDLPETIDFALVTHLHHDHYVSETLLRLRHRIGCLVVPRASGMLAGDISLQLASKAIGFKNVVELGELDSISLPGDAEIIAAPFLGEHGDLAHAKSAYVVRFGTEQILIAADSACLDETLYDHLRSALGPIQTVFLGTECVGAPLSWLIEWLFPHKPERSQELGRRHHGADAAGAMNLLRRVGAKRVYHYAMGQEPWLTHLGLGLSDESPQMREGDLMLAQARRAGFEVAQRLFGRAEFLLGEVAAARTSLENDQFSFD